MITNSDLPLAPDAVLPRWSHRLRRAATLVAVAPLVATTLLLPGDASASITGGSSADTHAKNDTYVSSSGHVEFLSVTSGHSWTVLDITANASAPVAPNAAKPSYFAWPDQHSQSVVYVDHSGHVIELYRLSGATHWTWADLTLRASGAHLAKPSSTAIGYAWTAGHSKQVIYLDTSGHINRLVTTLSADWSWSDMTTYLGAPAAASNSGLTAYDFPANDSDQIAYITSAGHIEEMYVQPGYSWSLADLTAYAANSGPVTAAMTSSPLVGYAAGRIKQVAYIGTDGHVDQLYDVIGSPWHEQDLTVAAAAPARKSGTSFTAYAAPDAVFVTYIDNSGYFEELSAPKSGHSWAVGNVSVNPAGGSSLPITGTSTVVGYYWSDGTTRQLAYIDASHHISELAIPLDGPRWSWTDLTGTYGGPLAA